MTDIVDMWCTHINELGFLNLKPEQTNIFFKLMEERCNRFPTILTTNFDCAAWQGFLGNQPQVEGSRPLSADFFENLQHPLGLLDFVVQSPVRLVQVAS